jgi:RimJ/RimL family protein N-acetyltransferase
MSRRITLGPFTASDLDDVFPIWSDFETVKLTNWRHTPTREACAERLEAVLAFYGRDPRHFGPFAIRQEDGRFVGLAGADVDAESPEQYDVWYVLRRDEWGKGIGTLALGALIDRMIASGRARRATATACTGNRGSWAILEKHGFHRDGVLAGGHTRHGLCLDLFEYSRAL